MTDATTHQPLRVFNHGTAGPYVIVPFTQLDEITTILKSHGLPHWVDEDVISIGGKPATILINFARNANAQAVQAILDGVH